MANEVKRTLKTRHLSMIALGGTIGTGLFVASGSAISQAGPGGALVAYIGIGLMVYFLMTSLGEMATCLPVSGSFATYSTKFVDPAFGFAMGWNYWINWAITLAVDISTAAIIMQYWFPHVPNYIFSLCALIIVFVINVLSVSSFGETEYWMALIKVIAVLAFLSVGVLTIVGIIGGHAVFLENFHYKEAPFVGGIPAIVSVFIVAGFSFQGTELVGITAGETENPTKSIPKAINQVFWRILLFYVLSIFIIACLIPYTSGSLLGSEASDIATSPFTLVFKRAGFSLAASVMNAVILTSVISSANSGLYAATRMLFAMSKAGDAPKVMGLVNGHGIPVFSLLATTFVGLLTFATSFYGQKIYLFLINAVGITGFITWFGIGIAHYRFRRALKVQNIDNSKLIYKAKWFPIGPLLTVIICLIITIGQDIDAFKNFNVVDILTTYGAVILFAILFLGYKLKNKSRLVALKEIDLSKIKLK
ncbi:amino acid permease [Ligilactobacillus equi]|uniref:APC family lysine-specific transporter n=1 Tax=Ligilactobacillus equi DPC 6820 TaxID=1392007 RepID=V7HY02_9LACO|nr:amino acid permease [Ligilactobacillus equi]ETA75124.1 APC family lysine-specific transporter [Ligilactobacillus equi DPC 6820]